jgi:hypothetical protein
MTDTMIKEQVRTIEKATQKAARSKESALKFLKDAGIITTPISATSKKKK